MRQESSILSKGLRWACMPLSCASTNCVPDKLLAQYREQTLHPLCNPLLTRCMQTHRHVQGTPSQQVTSFQQAFWKFLRPHTIRGTILGSFAVTARVLIECHEARSVLLHCGPAVCSATDSHAHACAHTCADAHARVHAMVTRPSCTWVLSWHDESWVVRP